MSRNRTDAHFHSMRSPYPMLPLKMFVLALGLVIASFPAPAAAKAKHYLLGNPTDVNPPLSGGVYDLGGGGTDVDDAIQWMINQVRGCRNCATNVDVVVIRSADNDPRNDNAYNQPILKMNGVDSVETIVISNRDDANQADVSDRVRQAEVVFFAGGDQCHYTRNFYRTGLEEAVKLVSARGGGVGGTSAGAMIQSELIYNACLQGTRNVTSRDALRDPYTNISFTTDLFSWDSLKGTLIDTHFDVDDRLGRLMAFIARQIRDGMADDVLGIGLSEATSLIVDKHGLAQVIGKGPVYFVSGNHQPEVCEPGQPLSFSNFKIWDVKSGQTFNLKTRPTSGYYQRSVDQGQLSIIR